MKSAAVGWKTPRTAASDSGLFTVRAVAPPTAMGSAAQQSGVRASPVEVRLGTGVGPSFELRPHSLRVSPHIVLSRRAFMLGGEDGSSWLVRPLENPPMTDPSNIAPPASPLTFTGYAPTVWQHANLAARWYYDALQEAQSNDGENSIRREVVFATSFLESYIFEWVRDTWFEEINEYFPATPRFVDDPLFRPTLKDKWKLVPQALHQAGALSTAPTLDLSSLGTLIQLRNGLIHARASRPATSGQPEAERPRPAMGELTSIGHGWALGVAKRLVNQLHEHVGTTPPRYL